MAAANAFRHRLRRLEDDLRRQAKLAFSRARGRYAAGSINVAVRSNIVSSNNVGAEDAVKGTSGTQRIRIRQRDGKTYEESETTRTMS
jgi:hypothetical protein